MRGIFKDTCSAKLTPFAIDFLQADHKHETRVTPPSPIIEPDYARGIGPGRTAAVSDKIQLKIREYIHERMSGLVLNIYYSFP